MRLRVATSTFSLPVVCLVPLALGACSSDEGFTAPGSGGAGVTGGSVGSDVGGGFTGGFSNGGMPAGGSSSGGAALGGSSSGGMQTGGMASGGASMGGSSTGGATVGGSSSGGTSTGGATTVTGGVSSVGGSGGVGQGTCAPGIDTGDECNPAADTEPCERSTRTCVCGSDERWACTPLGQGGSGGTTSETGGSGGESTGGMTGSGGEGGTGTGGSNSEGEIWSFVEDPGADCQVGSMPSVGSLTANPKLPDPFTKLDGTRMSSKSEWVCRREEILQMGYEFIYGQKPRTPKSAVSGSVSNNRITVEVSDGGGSTSFSVNISLPSSGSAPYPAVIGYGGGFMGSGIGFEGELGSRGIATISYDPYTLGQENGSSSPKAGAFYDVYGSNHDAGLLVAWAWGVSRILDVLEQDPSVIDPTKIAVTGCSRFGKGAFVAGVLDNRVALTIPVESGVGGTPALRLIGDLDSGGEWPYHAISYERWFSKEKLGQFATANNAGGDTTDKLPVDMHEMIGLVAPRGLYIVDNPSTNYAGLDRNSAWVTANVGAKIYEALGVPENITCQGASGGHCTWRSQYTPPLVANLEKFLLGNASANTGTFATDLGGTPNPESHYDWDVPNLSGDL